MTKYRNQTSDTETNILVIVCDILTNEQNIEHSLSIGGLGFCPR